MVSSASAAVIFIFWTVFFVVLSAARFFYRGEELVIGRVARLMGAKRRGTVGQDGIDIRANERESVSTKRLREQLLTAGLKRKSDLEKALLFRKVCYTAPAIVAIVAYLSLNATAKASLMAGVLSAVVFLALPRLVMIRTIFKHRAEISRHLPDTLDLLVVALEAGLSFDSAMVRVGEEQRRVSTHMSRELLYTNHEVLVGKPREDALRGLARRCGIDEMNSLARAVIQSNRLGSSLVKTLRGHAKTLRKKKRQDVHAQIMKAPVKLIFPLLFFIFPTLLIVILSPSLIQIFRHLGATGGL